MSRLHGQISPVWATRIRDPFLNLEGIPVLGIVRQELDQGIRESQGLCRAMRQMAPIGLHSARNSFEEWHPDETKRPAEAAI